MLLNALLLHWPEALFFSSLVTSFFMLLVARLYTKKQSATLAILLVIAGYFLFLGVIDCFDSRRLNIYNNTCFLVAFSFYIYFLRGVRRFKQRNRQLPEAEQC